jgi:hypothetical protein
MREKQPWNPCGNDRQNKSPFNGSFGRSARSPIMRGIAEIEAIAFGYPRERVF